MALDLVTGYKGTPHITAEGVGAFNAGIFGSGEYVLNSGNKFSSSLTSNNTVKILDGDLVMQGRHVTLKTNTFEEVTIENGESGLNRIDLIVARYTKDSNTGVENVAFAVIKGTATTGTATEPEYTTGDILSGDCTLNEMPLYKISLSGLTVGTPEAMFELSEFPLCEMSGLLYRGDMTDWAWDNNLENSTDYWRSVGSGIFNVTNGKQIGFNASGNKGTFFNIVSETTVSHLFFTNGFVATRISYNNEWSDSWKRIVQGVPYVTGTYTGDETPFQFIDLGFTPKAVLVTRSDGSMVRSHWGAEFGTYFYGGLATSDLDCLFWNGDGDYGVVCIETNGFRVFNNSPNDENTSASEKGYIHTNDKSKYNYIAFRKLL